MAFALTAGTAGAASAQLASLLGAGSFAGPIGIIGALAFSALQGAPTQHGAAIPGHLQGMDAKLRSTDRAVVEAQLRSITKAAWFTWGNCSQGGMCRPHRDGARKVMAGVGLQMAPECLSMRRTTRKDNACARAQDALNAAWLARRFSPPAAAPNNQLLALLRALGVIR